MKELCGRSGAAIRRPLCLGGLTIPLGTQILRRLRRRVTKLSRDLEMGAEERRSEFGDQLLAGVGAGAEAPGEITDLASWTSCRMDLLLSPRPRCSRIRAGYRQPRRINSLCKKRLSGRLREPHLQPAMARLA